MWTVGMALVFIGFTYYLFATQAYWSLFCGWSELFVLPKKCKPLDPAPRTCLMLLALSVALFMVASVPPIY